MSESFEKVQEFYFRHVVSKNVFNLTVITLFGSHISNILELFWMKIEPLAIRFFENHANLFDV